MNDLRAAAQQALEALLTPSGAQACSTCQNGPENEYCCRMEMWSAITALRAALAQQDAPRNQCGTTCERARLCAGCLQAMAQPVPHGCHVDVDHGMKPDGCVLDDGRPENCIYAKRLLREGKDKTACEYWQPIEVTR